MAKYNPKNERIKTDYFEWQKEANQKSDATIDNIRKAIDRFEEYTKYKDFKYFNREQAKGFKKKLSETSNTRSKEKLSKSTVFGNLRHLKDFFKWLAYKQGYKRIELAQIEYFNLSEKEERIAKAGRVKRVPTLEQIRSVINSMPYDNEIDLRNRFHYHKAWN